MQGIAILGAGSVGQALGERLLESGLSVRYGVRDPAASRAGLVGVLARVTVELPAAAVADAQIVLLAVPAGAAIDVARSAGSLDGKVVIDCTNPLRWENGPVWAPPPEGSIAQALAREFPGASIVKGFNHFGAEIQRRPDLEEGPADAFFAADATNAKAAAMQLASRMGFRSRDAGPLRNAALLENLAVLWIQLATAKGGQRNFAFRVAKQA